jgi:hypothetical protein
VSRIFDESPELGITRYWHYDSSSDTAVIETVQDATDLVDANKAAFNSAESGWKGDMHKVASIPLNVYYDLKEKGILDNQQALKAWLNDPENRYFRTKPGRV